MRGNEHDTREVITEIAALRAERAALLGFADHASYVVADRTAGTVEAVASMLGALVGPAVENARAEAAELEAALHADGHEGPLQPWDWAFYAERVKAGTVRGRRGAACGPTSSCERVLHDGVFRAATALYGITFDQRARPARLPPRRDGLRRQRRRRQPARASSSATGSRVTPSVAAPG